MSEKLRLKIMEILEEHRCLSTMEICRLVNAFPFNDYQVCHKGMVFGAKRGYKNLCNAEKNHCQTHYLKVYRGFANGALDVLKRRRYIKTAKMRFWDGGKALPTDTFRFWFLEDDDFKQRVLSQTLIPYTQMNQTRLLEQR